MTISALLTGFVVGAAISFAIIFFRQRAMQQTLHQREEKARQLIKAAEEKTAQMTGEIELRHKAALLKIEEETKYKYQSVEEELAKQKSRMDKREEQLDRKFDQLDQREREHDRQRKQLEEMNQAIVSRKAQHDALVQQVQARLEEVAGMTEEVARAQLMSRFEDDARNASARMFKLLETEAKENADRKAREIIATSIQRLAGEFVSEQTVSVVALPSEEMKGRIIGREGRNIRALETATGCDLIIDDTPEAVVISGFNPVRRQVARLALEELIGDGRIHPARIESVVKKATQAIQNEIKEAGEKAVFEVGLTDVHPEIIKLLGTLKFRTSYTQNVLSHSVEVAFLCGAMAEELGLNGGIARRCGLLHDIGKAVDHEVQGSHAVIGGQLAKKYREKPIVVNAIWSHHFDIEPNSVYGPLANAADALSAARPGARRENVETYLKRLEQLEEIATSFNGVEKAFAIQAGREVRVIVQYDKVNDEGSMMLARDIANRVENEMTYPGQIKVTVIREMRTTHIAN
ncbi:MAG: ribonuclease Y [Magnetococcales bacterium]|nr:ribonuclease Y [Magnetococcales bacterium]MBF0150662.1 ribonuclease Y [Magnetococcales bacterium]MBF0173426.1 ribonuclease Y [Magnetococcales bacterium]MBF0346342.1 ribonuclease Y [Magnetococcales bacterium]